MKHLGDITLIKGNEAPVVDCIVGGSPCQDLSVAGKRAGLAGERSGLYMEQIRIIKEMREHDRLSGRTGVDVRPRYMVWENVPGAFSSNGGKDFAAVIEEAIRIAEPEAPAVPVPQKGWPTSGILFDESGRWSVAWRVLDAQFWGVPQRRRRIALVADFGGISAPEILFVREGMRGYLEESQPQRKKTSGDAGESSGTHNSNGMNAYTLKIRGGCEGGGKGALIQTDKSATLSTLQDQTLFQPVAIENHPADSRVRIDESGKVQTLTSRMGTGGGNVPMIMEAKVYGIGSYHSNAWKSGNPNSGVYEADTAKTLDALNCGYPACNQGGMAVVQPVTLEPIVYDGANVTSPTNASNPKPGDPCHTLSTDSRNYAVYCLQGNGIDRADTAGCNGKGVSENVSYTLNTVDRHAVAFHTYQNITGPLMANSHPGSYTGQDAFSDMLVAGVDCRNMNESQELYPTLQAKPNGGQSLNYSGAVRTNYIVRRLTPLECERLQGFPDGWTDIGEWVDSKGKKHKEADSPRYKALGNSIAIPPWKWVLKRLCACYERDATMASLFDGIGGFPYIWEQLNGKGSCLWASEIEEFPMAVTKLRFGD